MLNCFDTGQVVQEEMSFKDISNLELVRRCKTICRILVEGSRIMRNNSAKLF